MNNKNKQKKIRFNTTIKIIVAAVITLAAIVGIVIFNILSNHNIQVTINDVQTQLSKDATLEEVLLSLEEGAKTSRRFALLAILEASPLTAS